jgi:hypothetical protein
LNDKAFQEFDLPAPGRNRLVLRETDDFLLLRGKGVESWWSVAFQRGATRRLATIVTTSTRDPQDARSWPIAQFPRSAPLSASR